MLARQLQVYTKFHNISAAELQRLGDLIKHMENAYNMNRVAVNVGSLEIVLRCPTLDTLEQLWSDCLTGRLNKVSERYLVTNEVRRKLGLESNILVTTIAEKNYRMCKKALMEMSGEFLARLIEFCK